MKFCNFLFLVFFLRTQGEELSVYTPGTAEDVIPVEDGESCSGRWEFGELSLEGDVGDVMSRPAFAITTGTGAAPKMSDMCNRYYKLTNEATNEFAFVFVAAYEVDASDVLEIGPTLCGVLCPEGTECIGGTGVTCDLAVEEVVSSTLVFTSVDGGPPTEAPTECSDESIDWTSDPQGGNGENLDDLSYGILIDGPQNQELNNPGCVNVYEVTGDTDLTRFVVVAAYEDEASTELSISLDLCNVLCAADCTISENTPCHISSALYFPKGPPVYSGISDETPDGTTQCLNSFGEWGIEGQGGSGDSPAFPAYGVYVDSETRTEKFAHETCGALYRLTSESATEPSYILMSAYESESSSEVAIGLEMCQRMCEPFADQCQVNDPSPCVITISKVGTPVYTGVITELPVEAQTACSDESIDWNQVHPGSPGGITPDEQAYGILVNEGTADEVRLNNPGCLDFYELSGDTGTVHYLVIAAYEEEASSLLSIGLTLCENLCAADCVEGEDAPCEISRTVHVLEGVPVYASVPDAAPDGAIECLNSPGLWGSSGEGGNGFSVCEPLYVLSVDSETPIGNFAHEECGTVREVHSYVSLLERFVMVTAYESEASSQMSIGLQLCQSLCYPYGHLCQAGSVSPCTIWFEETEEECPVATTSEEPTQAEDEIQVFMWSGVCDETSCGAVDWDSQTLCGSRHLPCFAKVEGTLNLVDKVPDSPTNGQEITAECGHLLALNSKHYHVVSVDEEKADTALYVADETFLGLCPVVCTGSNPRCAADALFCGGDSIYTDCTCPDDSTDTSCLVCEECSEEIAGRVRGALSNQLSVFAEGFIVGREEVGAAKEFAPFAALLAACLMNLMW